MGLPSALRRKYCASNASPFSPPLAFPGPCVCISFSATNSSVHRTFPASLTSAIKKRKRIVSTDFLHARAGPSTTPHPGFVHLHPTTRAHTKPFQSRALRLLALSQLFFFPIGKPVRMIEPVHVAKRLASTGSEGKKLSCVPFFFSCC